MPLSPEEVRAKLAAAGISVPQPVPPAPASPDLSAYAEFIPENPKLSAEQNEFSRQVDSVLDGIDIIAYYNTFCGKMKPKIGNRRESIMISCPIPGHADRNPSAWISLDKQTWFCGGCQTGGDKYDLAAYNLNFPVPGYKSGKTFGDLRKAMLSSFGYSTYRAPGARFDVLVPPGGSLPQASESGPHQPPVSEQLPPGVPVAPIPDGGRPAATTPTVAPPAAAAPAPLPSSMAQPSLAPADDTAAPLATVTVLHAAPEPDADDKFAYPSIDWRRLIAADTFLHRYCTVTAEDYIPEEYNFWYGLAAIGLALSKRTALQDKKLVYGNLYVCTVGASGAGKSQATGHIEKLLRTALPYDHTDPATRGAKQVGTPGSGEKLISSFTRLMPLDPSKPKENLVNLPVTGYVEFAELAELISRGARVGSILPQILMHFYDAKHSISTGSVTSGEHEAVDPFLSVFTTTQLRSIRSLLKEKDDNSGFLNRWLFSMGPEKTRPFLDNSQQIDVTTAAPPLQQILAWSSQHEIIRLSADAAKIMGDFWRIIGKPYMDATKDDNNMASRLDLLFKKIILLFAANNHEHVVTTSTIEQVIKLFPYVTKTLEAVFERVGISEGSDLARKVLNLIPVFNAQPYPPTARDIYRSLRKTDPGEIKKALENLAALGEIEAVIPVGKVGRPTVRYQKVANA